MNPLVSVVLAEALDAFLVGVTRESLLEKAKELDATPEQLPAAIRKMRQDKVDEAQRKIDAA